ncbi:CHASE domain-containing protein [Methyloversatilis sp.]|uniref:PAS domain-containing hybrid sensor histidine kinase/response regulator n=1 Tax=Methyloversatilis sp. TaxID=2569862 RepID=UPI003F6E9F95
MLQSPQVARRARLWPCLLLAAGLLLSATAARWQAADNVRRVGDALRAAGDQMAGRVAERVERYESGLSAARGVVLAIGVDSVTNAGFAAYTNARDLPREFPGARGFGFIRRVPADREAAFAAAAARDGPPGFAVRQLVPHDGERYVVRFIEPLAPNRLALGLDVASDPVRRAAVEAAARSGQATLSAPIGLLLASGHRAGYLLVLPVYRPGQALDSAEQRWAACAGWVYAPLFMDEVMQDVDTPGDGLTLTLTDAGEAGTAAQTLYTSPRPAAGVAADTAELTIERRRFDRPWRLRLQAQPAFVAALHLPVPARVFVTGAVLTVLATALLALAQAIRRSRLAAQQARRHLQSLVEFSSDAMITTSPEGVITGWNRAAERLLGHSAEQAIGQDVARLLLPPDSPPMAEAVRQRLQRCEPVEPFDQVLMRQDGQRVVMSIALSPIAGPDGRLASVGRTLRDISTRSAAERQRELLAAGLAQQVAERTAALSTAQRDLQAVLDAVPSLIGYWDRDLCNRFANHAYQTWFGVDPGAMAGRHIRELLGETLFEKNRPFLEAALRGDPQTFERAIPLPGGSGLRHSLAHYLPDVVDGVVQGFYVLVHDISAVKEGERRLADALRENEALLATIKAHSLYSVGDIQGNITDVNEGFCRISGYAREELVGQNYRVLSSGCHDRAFWVDMWRTIVAGQVWRGEVCNRAKDGSLYWVDSIIAPLRDSDGKPQQYLSIRHDITASKQAEQVMRRAMQAAEAASAAKSSFLANMSHEIRTPLNAMIGLTYLLEHGWLDPEQRSFVGKIQLASRSLLGVVNDVLDLAKIEAGEAQIELAPFDLHELLDGMATLYGDQTQAKGLAFRLSQPEDLPQRVLGDAGRLRQVLSNLLANAVKFTERGSVALVLRLVARDQAGLTLRFEVHDTGLGIAPEAQESIFQPFAQADSSTTRRFGGTGLGLSIVRELSALMGGEVQLDSTPGQGSIFRVTLRLGAVADDTAASTPSRVALRLLVVDDDPLQAATLLAQAHALGWRAEAVASSDAAVQTLRRQAEHNTLPDALLIDWQLPGGNGLQALAALAAAIGRERLPPAVLVSSADAATLRALPDDPQVDSRLALPVDASSLFNAVNRAVARRSGDPEKALRATRLEGAGALWLPGVRVLVVDDSDINREVAARILGREGALVTACESGADALERLRQTPQSFDLVLMDVQMPGMDGHEATRCIRGELGLAQLPVVALTAGALLAERQRALDAGMDDFISKPLDPDGLIRGVRRHVERARGKPLPVRLRELPLPDAGQLPWPEIEGIDGADAALRLGQDLALFRSLLQRLFREFADLMVEPPVVPGKESECAALAARAHKLRGSAGMLGARAVQRLAGELEAWLRRPAAAAAISGTAPLLDGMAALTRALRQLQEASAPVLAQPLPVALAPRAEPLTPAARDDLLQRLRVQDLSALDCFEALADGLRAVLGNARFDAAREAIENLHFAQALALLEEEETA